MSQVKLAKGKLLASNQLNNIVGGLGDTATVLTTLGSVTAGGLLKTGVDMLFTGSLSSQDPASPVDIQESLQDPQVEIPVSETSSLDIIDKTDPGFSQDVANEANSIVSAQSTLNQVNTTDSIAPIFGDLGDT